MYSFKKSLIALVGLVALVGGLAALLPLIGRGQGGGNNPLTRDTRRLFYLTQTTHDGSQALTACASGYHMASLWEIHDPTYLRYNTQIGLTKDDSGFGPPALSEGWIRTGENASNSNCQAWTSASDAVNGTPVSLTTESLWASPASVVSPWGAQPFSCNASFPVWCLQD